MAWTISLSPPVSVKRTSPPSIGSPSWSRSLTSTGVAVGSTMSTTSPTPVASATVQVSLLVRLAMPSRRPSSGMPSTL